MLLVRELPSGRIRFVIKDTATHSFIHMVECPGEDDSSLFSRSYRPEMEEIVSPGMIYVRDALNKVP